MELQRLARGVSVERLATWVALVAVGVFLVWSAVLIREITVPLYQNADFASAPTLAQFLPDQGSGYVTLGFYPWLESLYWLDLTRWLPSHEAAWKALPFVVFGITVGVFGWTVGRTVSRRAGLVAALAMATPSPFVIYMLGVPNQRLPALLHTVILAAFLVAVPRLRGWRLGKRAVWAAGLVLTLAAGFSSDPLLLLAAIIPFLVAVGLGWRLKLLEPRIAGFAGAACVAGALGGRGLEALAEHNRLIYNQGHYFNMAQAGHALSNAGLLLQDVALFAHGQFALASEPATAFNAGREVLAIAAIGAVLLFALVLGRSWRAILPDQGRPVELRLLGVYWAVSIVGVSLAFVIITAPVALGSVRYVTTLWPGLLTLVLVVYGRRAVTTMAIFAAGIAILGCIELGRGYYTYVNQNRPQAGQVEQLEKFVADNDLDHGYAGYWDAAPIDVESDFKVHTYPIEPCEGPLVRYCPFRVHTISTWYVPKQGVRSFYAVGDPTLTPSLKPPPAEWGRPFKTARFGNLTVYAYDYDIAARISPVKPGETPPGTE
jgi:hypothetical protein